jgi:hypothetical protein
MDRPDAVYTTAVALALDQLAAEVVRELDARGIEAILLKGPVLAEWLYGDGTARAYGDVDLLVAPADLATARAAAVAAGVPPGEELIDVVDELRGVGRHPARAWPVLREATERGAVAGQPVLVLTPPARALHVALHAAWHGPRSVKPVVDLERALVAADEATWKEAAALAERLDAVPAFVVGLSTHPAGRELPARLGLPEAADVRGELGYLAASPVALRLEDVRRATSGRATARAVSRLVLPPRTEMALRYPLARRGPAGLVAAHVQRAVVRLPQAPRGALEFARAVRRGRRKA